MYKVEYPIWRGYSSVSYCPAGSFDTYQEAEECAKACYGRILNGNSIVSSYEKH